MSFSAGVSTTALSATLYRAGTDQVTATSSSPQYLGRVTLQVTPASPSQFGLQTPATATAGVSFSATVTAQDPYGNTTPAYAGTVCLNFSGLDTAPDGTDTPQYPAQGSCAAGQSSVTFTNGTVTVGVVPVDEEMVPLSVTDGTISGTSSTVVISGGTTASLSLTVNGSTTSTEVAAGTQVSASVIAYDQYDNVANADASTLTPNNSDGAATYNPSTLTLSTGALSFQVTFNSSGMQTFSVSEGTIPSNTVDVQVD
ncbi:MAG: hypothetical protein JOY80_05860 [Candidatus Dormibacteraeota bacterium]|nr:hypothetical protein [Candidatus Dormibacteraeota bacterium]